MLRAHTHTQNHTRTRTHTRIHTHKYLTHAHLYSHLQDVRSHIQRDRLSKSGYNCAQELTVRSSTDCNALHHSVPHYITRQHIAPHCNTPHIASYCCCVISAVIYLHTVIPTECVGYDYIVIFRLFACLSVSVCVCVRVCGWQFDIHAERKRVSKRWT